MNKHITYMVIVIFLKNAYSDLKITRSIPNYIKAN
jgi:hypothetical protein